MRLTRLCSVIGIINLLFLLFSFFVYFQLPSSTGVQDLSFNPKDQFVKLSNKIFQENLTIKNWWLQSEKKLSSWHSISEIVLVNNELFSKFKESKSIFKRIKLEQNSLPTNSVFLDKINLIHFYLKEASEVRKINERSQVFWFDLDQPKSILASPGLFSNPTNLKPKLRQILQRIKSGSYQDDSAFLFEINRDLFLLRFRPFNQEKWTNAGVAVVSSLTEKMLPAAEVALIKYSPGDKLASNLFLVREKDLLKLANQIAPLETKSNLLDPYFDQYQKVVELFFLCIFFIIFLLLNLFALDVFRFRNRRIKELHTLKQFIENPIQPQKSYHLFWREEINFFQESIIQYKEIQEQKIISKIANDNEVSEIQKYLFDLQNTSKNELPFHKIQSWIADHFSSDFLFNTEYWDGLIDSLEKNLSVNYQFRIHQEQPNFTQEIRLKTARVSFEKYIEAFAAFLVFCLKLKECFISLRTQKNDFLKVTFNTSSAQSGSDIVFELEKLSKENPENLSKIFNHLKKTPIKTLSLQFPLSKVSIAEITDHVTEDKRPKPGNINILKTLTEQDNFNHIQEQLQSFPLKKSFEELQKRYRKNQQNLLLKPFVLFESSNREKSSKELSSEKRYSLSNFKKEDFCLNYLPEDSEYGELITILERSWNDFLFINSISSYFPKTLFAISSQIEKIIYIKAARQYVEVYTNSNDCELLKGGIGAIAVLFKNLMIYPHRSYLIPKKQIQDKVVISGKPHFVLSNGEKIPVADNRIDTF